MNHIPDLTTEECPTEGRYQANRSARRIRFVDADDSVAKRRIRTGFVERHRGGEVDPIRLGRRCVDDRELIEAFRQKTDPAVDLPQPLFSVDVFRVLGAITQGCCRRDLRRHFPSLDALQVVELPLEGGKTRCGDVTRRHERTLARETASFPGVNEPSERFEALFAALRAEASRSAWSRAVELARADRVATQPSANDELIARVDVPGAVVTPTAILYPALEDWECDCHEDEPCAHVLAAVIALRRADREGRAVPQVETSQGTIRYGLSRRDGVLHFQRFAVVGDRSEPLRGTLDAIARGRVEGPRVAASERDFEIERTLGSQRSGRLPRGILHRILAALRDEAGRVTLDDEPICTDGAPLSFVARLRDDGPDFLLTVERELTVDEHFADDVVRCGDTLRPTGQAGLSGRELEQYGRGARFRPDDAATLVTEILPELAKRITVEVQTDRLPRGEALEPRPEVELEREGEALRVLATVVYGDPPVARIDADRLVPLGDVVPLRDRNAEARVVAALRQTLGVAPGHAVVFRGREALVMAERLRAVPYAPQDALASFRERRPLSLVARRGGDGFAFESDGIVASAEHVVRAWRDGAEFLALDDGGLAPLPSDWLERHGDTLADLLAARDSNGALPASAAPALEAFCEEQDLPAPAPPEALRRMLELSDASDLMHENFAGTLRDYQVRGLAFVQSRTRAGFGALLADDMGLGKTVQTLAGLRGRTLVVAPTSVLHNWLAEATRFRPDLRACLYHGSTRTLDDDADLVLTSYAILRLDQSALAARPFDTVVLDEAQNIKNPDSQTARAARALRGEGRVALTGTPVENRLEELWSIFAFLNPGLLGARSDFSKRTARPAESGDPGALERLTRRTAAFFLRRTKEEVTPELPPRQEVTRYIELGDDERACYDAIRAALVPDIVRDLRAGAAKPLGALEALLRLRQAACHGGLVPGSRIDSSSKLSALADALETAAAAGHRALIFSQWTSLLDRVEPVLTDRGVSFLRIDGSTRDRAGVVEAFQAAGGPRALLISLHAGGTGLNLTAADHVFILDPWWNPAVEAQAAARAHRIGQTKPVLVQRLVARDTVEERVVALQARKQSLADAAAGGAADRIDAAELLELLLEELR